MIRSNLAPAIQACLKRLPAPYEAHYGVVTPPPPSTPVRIDDVATAHGAALQAIGRADFAVSGQQSHFLYSRILQRVEAVKSSDIEGTHSTLDELLESEEADDADETDATRQVRDYAVVLQKALAEVNRAREDAFTHDLLAELHRAVMANDPKYEDVPGEIRTRVVWIGGGRGGIEASTYNPCPPEDIRPCLDEHLSYLRGENGSALHQTIIVRMAVAHAHFEAIHPYRDGNGRVGRLLLPLMLASVAHVPLYLSPYISDHSQAYMDALRAAQQRLDYQPLVGLLSNAIAASFDEADRLWMRLVELKDGWRGAHSWRQGSAASRLLDILPNYPVITARRAERLLGVTFAAANRGIQQLIDRGILEEKTGYRRNRLFVAKQVTALLNGRA